MTNDEYFQKLTDETHSYVKHKALYTKLVLTEKTATITSHFVVFFILFFIAGAGIIFGSFMLGYLFSEQLDSFFYGFGIITGIYLFVFFIIYLFRGSIMKKIGNQMIQMILKEDEE